VVVGGAVVLQKLVRVFAIGNVQYPQLHVPAIGHLFDFADRPLGRFDAGGIGIES
jgi:hypothetical protein